MSKLVIYRVNGLGGNNQPIQGTLEPAKKLDMTEPWMTCAWSDFWEKLDLDCDAIIKLSCQGQTLGLVKIGLYPFPFKGDRPDFVEIGNIETADGNYRLMNPIGLWLIWYATKIALAYCVGDDEGSIVTLDGYEEYLEYYRDKVGLEPLYATTIGPNEEGYAFRFTRSGAIKFCTRMENEHGFPQVHRYE